jgi:homoserine kinase
VAVTVPFPALGIGSSLACVVAGVALDNNYPGLFMTM